MGFRWCGFHCAWNTYAQKTRRRRQVKVVASTFTLRCNLSQNSFKVRAQTFLTSCEAYFWKDKENRDGSAQSTLEVGKHSGKRSGKLVAVSAAVSIVGSIAVNDTRELSPGPAMEMPRNSHHDPLIPCLSFIGSQVLYPSATWGAPAHILSMLNSLSLCNNFLCVFLQLLSYNLFCLI